MKKLALVFCFILSLNSVDAQIRSANELRTQGFNPPPNVVFRKVDVTRDLSYKLDFVSNVEPSPYTEPDFLKGKTWEQVLADPEMTQEEIVYYTQAKAYFDSLSHKIKVLYNAEELWHIYYFDATLKESIRAIH